FYMDGLRGSAFPGHVPVALRHEPRHEVCGLARDSHSVTRFRSRHENCQYHFLTEDPFTVGVEIPVWLESREILDFAEVFGGRGPLTGHIDLVREKSGVIEVWDYKPGAKRERTAATQVFLYTLMLSIRTGIPLKHFQCGYFDEHDCYTFSPLNLHILR
ncbi:PD-(D/E)XK nuclease family protein, partial [Myxococcota bacterium]|nr:PD-(D/E)XK nuclease family protein [Myxococcota bacterium]